MGRVNGERIRFLADVASEPVREWQRMAERLRSGEITQGEYDRWRYTLAGKLS